MYRYGETEERRLKKIAEGRGGGAGAHYLAWIKYGEVASRGTKGRQVEGRHRRPVLTLSDVETSFLDVSDCDPNTLETYDQFPLDLEETMRIAEDLNVEHPRCTDTGTPLTMTTDFLVHYRTPNGTVEIPVQCKFSRDLLDYNIAEHLEIERIYWSRQDKRLRVVTETDRCIPVAVRQNCSDLMQHRFMHQQRSEEAATLSFSHRADMLEHAVLDASQTSSLNDVAHSLASQTNTTVDKFTAVLFNLLYHRRLDYDVTRPNLLQHDVLEIAARTRTYRKKGGQQ